MIKCIVNTTHAHGNTRTHAHICGCAYLSDTLPNLFCAHAHSHTCMYTTRILVWEDGFCNFAASSTAEMNSADHCPPAGTQSVYGNCEYQQYQGLQPDLFFKMSHEIYNYGEG